MQKLGSLHLSIYQSLYLSISIFNIEYQSIYLFYIEYLSIYLYVDNTKSEPSQLIVGFDIFLAYMYTAKSMTL